MYEAGKPEEYPNVKGLALIINKDFTDYVEKKHTDRIILCKIILQGKHHKPHKSMPLQVTMMMKQLRCSTKNLKRLWTRKPGVITF